MLLLSAAAIAADEPEAVYQKLHAAAMARNVDEMLRYATEARRTEMRQELQGKEEMVGLMVALMPKTYRLTGKAASPDGNAAQLRAAGTGEFMGLGNTQMYGTIDFVKEKDEWKVEHWAWSGDKPGALPTGFVLVQGQAPEARSVAEPKAPRKAEPQPAPKPEAQAESQPVLTIEKSTKPEECVIKPVMTDDELRACGARIPK